jgi:predicted ATP-dependent serine protease
MAQHDLFDKSPIRLINKITNGSLKRGDAALIASKKGLGKTSVLVQFGVDDLFQDKQVVHVSFNQKTENVITGYEDVFTENAKKKPARAHSLSDLVKKRVILNFNQDIIALPSVMATVRALAASGIKSECLLIDDLDFSKIAAADLQAIRDYARDEGIFVCASTTSEGETAATVVPPEFESVFDTVFRLAPRPDMIELQCLKNAGGIAPVKLRLVSKTLLIMEK